jgi:hypothetical protein
MEQINNKPMLRIVAIIELYPDKNGWGQVLFYKDKPSYRIAKEGETKGLTYVYAYCQQPIDKQYVLQPMMNVYILHPYTDLQEMKMRGNDMAHAHNIPVLYREDFADEIEIYDGKKSIMTYYIPDDMINEYMKQLHGFDGHYAPED